MVYYNPYYEIAMHLDAITKDCIQNKKKIAKNKLQEPDVTATIVTDFPNKANTLFPFIKCKFGGCFVHQSPKVEFKDSRGNDACCEAGDLLVLCRRKENSGERYNSALFQLKMHRNKKFIHNITKDTELRQLELYQKWPRFNIQFKKTKYNICPQTVSPGSQYLYVLPVFSYILCPAIPARSTYLDLFYTWGDFLLDFIQWRNGRPISQECEANNDDWSKFIWELINRSRKNVYIRDNIGHTNVPRSNGDFFSLMLSQSKDVLLNDNMIGQSHKEKEEPMGISILFIDVREDELR